jgi:phosphoserine aminotransferase
MLWGFIDSSDGYYKSKITDKKYRSKVNVVFRILDGNTEIEEIFIKCAKKIGIV